jgi:predicted transcriptional regulator of viral defense system
VRVHDLNALLGPHRTASTIALRQVADAGTVSRWVTSGWLVRLHPGWVTLPELADDWIVRAHAAAGYTGGVLSHWSALHLHGLLAEGVTRLDVTVPRDRRVRTSRWLRVHRSTRACTGVRARGLPVTPLPRALVDTWGSAHGAGAMRGAHGVARQALMDATRRQLVTSRQIEADLAGRPQLPGRAELVDLLGFVAAGCQS